MSTLRQVQVRWKDRDRAEYWGWESSRSDYLVSLFDKYIPDKSAKVLEIGCNIGRNLYFLHQAGYTNLHGNDINQHAFIRRENEFWADAPVQNYIGPIEDYVKQFDTDEFDVVFTMACLEHIHVDSNWIFTEISRSAKRIITIEDEVSKGPFHFPRNYTDIFAQEFETLFEKNLREDLGKDWVNFWARVLRKK